MRFKATFRCLELLTTSGKKRALILGVGQVPNVSGLLDAVLVLEDASVVHTKITLSEFNQAERNLITMFEEEKEEKKNEENTEQSTEILSGGNDK